MFFFFFQAEDGIRDIGVTGVQTCALPISILSQASTTVTHVNANLELVDDITGNAANVSSNVAALTSVFAATLGSPLIKVDRKSTRLNSSHANISYAVFCLKKKKKKSHNIQWSLDSE